MDSFIEINPDVCHGKPVIRGTRVLVSTLLGALSAGSTAEEVLEDYPNVSREALQAVFNRVIQMRDHQWLCRPPVA